MKVRAASGGGKQAAVSSRRASYRQHRGPLTLGGLTLALGTAATLPCRAAGTCALEVTGPDTPAWREAVGSLDLRAADDSDCATIRLALGDETSRLTFVTNDGRTAERNLREPSELAPTLEALLVTGTPSPSPQPEPEPEPEPEPAAAPPRRSRSPLPSPDLDDSTPSLPVAPAIDALTAAFTLQLGVRGGASGLVSPVIYGAVTMDRSRWEIGVWGALEPEYGAFGASESAPSEVDAPMAQGELRPVSVPPRGNASAGAVGVMVGRRFPFTHLDVVLGGRVGVAALRHDDGSDDGAELRTGASLELVFPRRSTLRFRTGLGAEVVPNDLSRSSAAAVPWWALSGRLGIEVGGT
jgi:hypothetical protein